MLAAVLHGKAARVTVDGEDVSWRDLFRRREDLLTAAFFGRFLYLSTTMRREALALLVGHRAAADLGDIEEIVFWPSLKLNKGERGGKVEPDVVFECKNALIMVEVKPPWGSGRQNEEQWHNEVKALKEAVRSGADAVFEASNVVHFVALGQNFGLSIKESFADFDADGFFDFELHQKEWSDIFKSIDSWEKPEENRDCAVIADWYSIFELFGIRHSIKPKPLTELCKLPFIFEDSFSLLLKMRTISYGSYAYNLLPLQWYPLLSFSMEHFMEDSQCKSLLMKLAHS